jgi:hypothetical protein
MSDYYEHKNVIAVSIKGGYLLITIGCDAKIDLKRTGRKGVIGFNN